MKEISILLTKYSDWISNLVYHICGRGYTHASIALEDEPDTYYSFNYHGFAVETVEKHRRRGVKRSRCYRIPISNEAYEKIQNRIQDFMERRETYRYTRLGVLCCVCHIPFHRDKHYFCSHFVAELLEQSEALELKKPAVCFQPNHFIELLEAQKKYQLIDNIV